VLGDVVLTRLGLREQLSGGFRTEFFIKTGLVLLGTSINIAVVATAAGPAILQALILISIVFFFTWWLGGRLGLDDRLRRPGGVDLRDQRGDRGRRCRASQRSSSSWRSSRSGWSSESPRCGRRADVLTGSSGRLGRHRAVQGRGAPAEVVGVPTTAQPTADDAFDGARSRA
jgi:hypothetical protein